MCEVARLVVNIKGGSQEYDRNRIRWGEILLDRLNPVRRLQTSLERRFLALINHHSYSIPELRRESPQFVQVNPTLVNS
jgi:hypothetical protein